MVRFLIYFIFYGSESTSNAKPCYGSYGIQYYQQLKIKA